MRRQVSRVELFIAIGASLGLAALTTAAHYWGMERFPDVVANQMIWHRAIIEGHGPARDQRRILTYLLAEILIRLGTDFVTAYLSLRFVINSLTFMVFYYFMKRWLSPSLALAGCWALTLGWLITYRFDFFQPTDPLGLLTFLAAVWLIRDGRSKWLFPVMVIAGLNREVIVLFVAVVLVAVRMWKSSWRRLFTDATGVLIFGFSGYAVVSVTIGGFAPSLGQAFRLTTGSTLTLWDVAYVNLRDPATYFQMFYMFHLLPFLGLHRWRDKPRFLKRAALGLFPVSVGLALAFTLVKEGRQMLPLLLILIPLALYGLNGQTAEGPTGSSTPVGASRRALGR